MKVSNILVVFVLFGELEQTHSLRTWVLDVSLVNMIFFEKENGARGFTEVII